MACHCAWEARRIRRDGNGMAFLWHGMTRVGSDVGWQSYGIRWRWKTDESDTSASRGFTREFCSLLREILRNLILFLPRKL
jgi:hypothetical protein